MRISGTAFRGRFLGRTPDFFSQYRAETQGRTKWGHLPSDSAPIMAAGRILLANGDRREAIGGFFHGKLSAPRRKRDLPPSPESAPDFRPVPRSRVRITKSLLPGTLNENNMATCNLPARRSQGPGSTPALFYTKTPRQQPLSAAITHIIFRGGSAATHFPTTCLVPPTRQGDGPRKCESRRPISLLNATVQIPGSVLHSRTVRNVDPALNGLVCCR